MATSGSKVGRPIAWGRVCLEVVGYGGQVGRDLGAGKGKGGMGGWAASCSSWVASPPWASQLQAARRQEERQAPGRTRSKETPADSQPPLSRTRT